MSPEHTKELFALAPNLYRQKDLSVRESAMGWGFQCGDGWFELIKQLSIALESKILELKEEDRKNFSASTVKEKLGGLRFYMGRQTVEMQALISKYEALSFSTCEQCGSSGSLYVAGNYLHTACAAHARPNAKLLRPLGDQAEDSNDDEDGSSPPHGGEGKAP